MDVMTRAVATIPPHLALNDALALMDDPGSPYLVVADGDGTLLGVVAASAMLRHMGKRRDWQSSAVEQIMSRDPCTIAPTAALEAAARLMAGQELPCLPVVDASGKVCGILNPRHFSQAYLNLRGAITVHAGTPLRRWRKRPSSLPMP
jgi:arabinose-5-phosphate isomerase